MVQRVFAALIGPDGVLIARATGSGSVIATLPSTLQPPITGSASVTVR